MIVRLGGEGEDLACDGIISNTLDEFFFCKQRNVLDELLGCFSINIWLDDFLMILFPMSQGGKHLKTSRKFARNRCKPSGDEDFVCQNIVVVCWRVTPLHESFHFVTC